MLANQGSLSRKARSRVRLLSPSSGERCGNCFKIHCVLSASLTGPIFLCDVDGAIAMKEVSSGLNAGVTGGLLEAGIESPYLMKERIELVELVK